MYFGLEKVGFACDWLILDHFWNHFWKRLASPLRRGSGPIFSLVEPLRLAEKLEKIEKDRQGKSPCADWSRMEFGVAGWPSGDAIALNIKVKQHLLGNVLEGDHSVEYSWPML